MKLIENIPVFGDMESADVLKQIKSCGEKAEKVALMADHHVGYSMPIGGVAAYKDYVSPSGVGYDIACGNKAIKLDLNSSQVKKDIAKIVDELQKIISFGVGKKNNEKVDHDLFDDPAWKITDQVFKGKKFNKDLARDQLGTVGSGNHYVDIFIDQDDYVWVGVHFGSRGLGHKIASYFIEQGGGKDGMFVAPVLLDVKSELGEKYIKCMQLAGRYAYAGRDWVCNRVAKFLQAKIIDEVHNHHNFAWQEEHFGKKLWVIRKGATPAFPGQRGFVGGSMGDLSVILEGVDGKDSKTALYSTVHGAGRVMGRREAAGKFRWKHGKKIQISRGKISHQMMFEWVKEKGVQLRGAGVDESPHCYKRIEQVLDYHKDTIKITHYLKPIGVIMAGEGEFDPYKD